MNKILIIKGVIDLNNIKSFLLDKRESFDAFMEYVEEVYIALENTSLSNQLFNFQKIIKLTVVVDNMEM